MGKAISRRDTIVKAHCIPEATIVSRQFALLYHFQSLVALFSSSGAESA